MAKDNTEKQRILTIGVNFDKMPTIRKFQNEIELATSSVIPLGVAVHLASAFCSKILAGEKVTKTEIIKGAEDLTNG